MTAARRRAKMGASGAARGPVTTAVFKTVCGAVMVVGTSKLNHPAFQHLYCGIAV